MGQHRSDVDYAILSGETLVATVRGFLTRTRLDGVLQHCGDMVHGTPGRWSVVLDLTGVTAFEPGAPARWVAWMRAEVATVSTLLLVSPSKVLAAAVRASSLLLPEQSLGISTSRNEALAMVTPPRVDRRKAQASGNYPTTQVRTPVQRRLA